MDTVILENVNKTFGSSCVVDNLSVRCPEKNIYGFLGPNGAGKTTTLRMIMNILRPDSGNISICGMNSCTEAKGKIGYLPEERGLYQKMTVQNHILYIAALKGARNKSLSEVAKWMDVFDLTKWKKHKVEELSKGMQQKLQFIIAVINNPNVLILDEPFSGLDPINVELITNIILDLKSSGKTIIYSTHVMEQAEKLCDSILLIDKGKKIFDGSYEQLKSRYENNIVCIKLEGNTSILNRLPIIESVNQSNGKFEVRLSKNVHPQELLVKLAQQANLKVFETKCPTLHEFFIEMIGQK